MAELATSSGANMNHDSAPRPSKPRTRSAARIEAEAEEARKRRESGDAARWLLDTRPPYPEAAVAPYVGDIDRYLRSLEVEPLRRPSPGYFQDIQKDICPKMRAVVVDWLVVLAEEFELHAETIHLAVSYVDRFLTMNVVARDKLQLLAVTALLVAAKYEEIESAEMKVVKMEADLLKSLNFQIGSPTVTTFLRQFIASCRGGNSTSRKKLEFVCSYLADLSLLDYDCISYLPSVVAAACLFVARFTIQPKTRPWNLTLEQNTG